MKRATKNKQAWVAIKLKNGGVVLVDIVDYPVVSRFSWRRRDELHTSYAYTVKRLSKRPSKLKYILMHRLILGLTSPTPDVDHKNHNGLDNRRANIWACTRKENLANRRIKNS